MHVCEKWMPVVAQGSQDGKRPVLALLLSHAARQKELAGGTQPALPRPRPVPIPVVEPWVVKHSPRTTADLVVHNRKVQDVRDWLLARLASVGLPVFGDSSLLVSGACPCPCLYVCLHAHPAPQLISPLSTHTNPCDCDKEVRHICYALQSFVSSSTPFLSRSFIIMDIHAFGHVIPTKVDSSA